MIKDPYKTLGLNDAATDKEVKRAYKKLAQKYHPDRCRGDEDVFKSIKQAYEQIIKGTTEPDNKIAAALTDLSILFHEVIRECFDLQPHYVDLISKARNNLQNKVNEITNKETQAKATMDIYTRLKGRMTTKSELNTFEMFLDHVINEINAELKKLESQLIHLKLMKEMLVDYKFRFDKKPEPEIITAHTFADNLKKDTGWKDE